jgi:drug/metabolite transporter (DMT)-like permease
MPPALWGAATALSWGFADVIGRWTGGRFGATVALAGAMLTSVLFIGALLLLQGEPLVRRWDLLLLPLVSGVANAIGTFCLIVALVRGPVTVTSPITASYPAINLMIGVVLGALITWDQWLAIGGVMLGIVLVSRAPAERAGGVAATPAERTAARRRLLVSVAIALVCALGFALSIHGVQQVALEQGELQATFLMRVGGAATAVAMLLALPRSRGRVPARWWPALSLQGLLDGGAYVLLLHGSHGEGAQIVVVAAGAYCVVPVLFGRFVLRERMASWQVLGFLGILAGIGYLAGAH